MENSNSAIILLSSTLLISLVVERLLEIINGLYRLIEIKTNGYRYWNSKAERLQRRLQQIRQGDGDEESDSARTRAVRSRIIGSFLNRLRVEESPYSEVDSISAEKIRKYSVKFAAKFIGIIIGVAIALLADIDIFKLIDQMLNPDATLEYGQLAEFLHKVATGIAMGLGSGPLHKIILAMEKAKKNRKNI
jgi:hypothetical protein